MKHLNAIKPLKFIALLFAIFSFQETNAQWVHTSCPVGGGITSFAFNGSNCFVGTHGGGVFLSGNMGTNWSPVNTGLTNTKVFAMAALGNTLFAGTEGAGVFSSVNNGGTWAPANNGLITGDTVNCFTVLGAKIFAGTYKGLYLSLDNGASWSNVKNEFIWTLSVKGTDLFAATGSGVFLSTNSGGNWSQADAGITDPDVAALGTNGTTIFAGTFGGGVFASENDGSNWSEENAGLTNLNVLTLFSHGNTIFAGTYGGGVFSSVNNGASWTNFNTGLTNKSVFSSGVIGNTIFIGTANGVWKYEYDPTGLKSLENTSGIKVYPGSDNSSFSIENPKQAAIRKINVINTTGQLIYSENPVDPDKTIHKINTDEFSKGIYYINIEVENELVSRKILIQ